MINDIDIGHNPILSDVPIIARREISDARNRVFRLGRPMRRVRNEAEKKAVGKRLQEARKMVPGLTQKVLAEKLQLPQSVISDWETGALESWTDYIEELAAAFGRPNDELEALAQIGPELLDRPAPEPDLPRPVDRSGLPEILPIPEYEVKLSAGAGYFVDDEAPVGMWPFARRYIVDELGLHAAHLSMVQITGDSMEPTLKSGDRVLIDRSDVAAGAEGVFAIWNSLATVVKRVEVVQPITDPVRLRLISDNPRHSPYEVPVDQLAVIGRVVWYGRRF